MSTDIHLQGAEVHVRDLSDVTIPYRSSYSIDPQEAHANLTYNLSPMLYAAGMPPFGEFDGMTGAQAGPIWEAVADELFRDPDLYKTLDPENGWGDYGQALAVMEWLHATCARFPDCRVAIC